VSSPSSWGFARRNEISYRSVKPRFPLLSRALSCGVALVCRRWTTFETDVDDENATAISRRPGPKVRRLFPGGNRIRTNGPAIEHHLRRCAEVSNLHERPPPSSVSRAELKFRIHSPPAESPCLAGFRPPASKRRAFPAGLRGGARQRGRERRAWQADKVPAGGSVSVRPNSSTAAWWLDHADRAKAKASMLR